MRYQQRGLPRHRAAASRAFLETSETQKGKALHMEIQGPDEDFDGKVDEVASEAGIHGKSDPDDWMGPLDVSMEVWERGPSGPQQRGNRTVSILTCEQNSKMELT